MSVRRRHDGSWPQETTLDEPAETHDSLNRAETLCLAVCRDALTGYCTQDVAHWERGLQRAVEALGAPEGAALFGRAAGLIHAVRHERAPDFRFMPAGHPSLSPDERALIAVIRAAQGADGARLEAAAADLTAIAEAPRVSAAARALARSLGPPSARPVSSPLH